MHISRRFSALRSIVDFMYKKEYITPIVVKSALQSSRHHLLQPSWTAHSSTREKVIAFTARLTMRLRISRSQILANEE